MTPVIRRRLMLSAIIVLGLSLSVGVALYGLRDQVVYFFTPSEVVSMHTDGSPHVANGRVFRLGGLVLDGSVTGTNPLRFQVTDTRDTMTVTYDGVLPTLFAEGQGVIAEGRLEPDGTFTATTLLAKHDENYMPPPIAKKLKQFGHPANGQTGGMP